MQKISTILLIIVSLFLGISIQGLSNNVDMALAPSPPPPVVAGVLSPNPIPTSICNGDTINFVADTAGMSLTSFTWNFNGAAVGLQTLFGQSVQFISGNAGAFTFDLVVGDGISLDTFNFNITINACTPPTIVISGTPTTVCEGSTVAFTDATVPGSVPLGQRDWVFPGGVPAVSQLATPVITYNVVGTYSVYFQIQDANGTYRDTLVNYINVVSCPTPVAEFSALPTKICPGDCVNFQDQSLNMVPGPSTWSWAFPGSDSAVSVLKDPTICYQIPGKYDVTLTVTNPNGTDTQTKISFIVVDSCTPPIAKFSAEKQKICKGTCVQFFDQSSRADSISWTFFGVNPLYQFSSESNPIVCYDDTGLFDVQFIAINDFGADIDTSGFEFISVKDFPGVNAPADTSVLIGNSVKLQAFGSGTGFRWTPDYEIECAFCSRAEVSPKENTKYYITNINENGCESTDSVNVIVYIQYYRGVPDAFSPNGDEENDVFLLYGNGITEIEFYVYDRHGNIVFESRDQAEGWDGTLNGEMMEVGVYAYFVKITYQSGYQEIIKGNVSLVR